MSISISIFIRAHTHTTRTKRKWCVLWLFFLLLFFFESLLVPFRCRTNSLYVCVRLFFSFLFSFIFSWLFTCSRFISNRMKHPIRRHRRYDTNWNKPKGNRARTKIISKIEWKTNTVCFLLAMYMYMDVWKGILK